MAVEEIGGFRVMFDCGSLSNNAQVNQFVDDLYINGWRQIDCFVLSHYDEDHVNSISHLLQKMTVVNAYVPLIPGDMEIVFNAASGGAYNQIRNLLTEHNCSLIEVGNIDNGGNQPAIINHDLWQWDIHSMIKPNDWVKIKGGLRFRRFDLSRINDFNYVSANFEIINRTFKSLWRNGGSNGKGLVMLSQRSVGATVTDKSMKFGIAIMPLGESKNTGCLFVGDANLKNRTNIKDINKFINAHIVDRPLHLVQVPHHGSQWSVNQTYYSDFVSEYYYINDKNTVRAGKNAVIWPLKANTMMVTADPQTRIIDVTNVQ